MQYIYNKESLCEVMNFKYSSWTNFIHIKCWDEVFIVDNVPWFFNMFLASPQMISKTI